MASEEDKKPNLSDESAYFNSLGSKGEGGDNFVDGDDIDDDDGDDGGPLECSWSMEKSRELIAFYAEEKCLWDTSAAYTREMRRAAYKRLGAVMGVSRGEVCKKIRHLRTYYLTQMKKVKSGGRAKCQWVLYDLMDAILRDHMQKRTSSSFQKINSDMSSSLQVKMLLDAHADHEPFPSVHDDVEDNDDSANVDDNDSANNETRGGVGAQTDSSDSFKTSRVKSSVSSRNSSRNLKRIIQRRAAKGVSYVEPEVKRSRADTSGSSHPSGSAAQLRHLNSSTPKSASAKPTEKDDPDETFGRHVANELRLITTMKAKQFAKLQIINTLFNAQFSLGNTVGAGAGAPSRASPDGK